LPLAAARAAAATSPNTLPARGAAIRVATLNLWGHFADWPRRCELLATELPRLDVDAYLLQEVVIGEGRGDQLCELAERLGYQWTTRVVAESRPHETEHEGVAILARLPLLDTATWPLPRSRPPRQRLEATLATQEGRIRLITLHAAVSSADGRDEQLAALAELQGSAVLLGADLNAEPPLVRPLLGHAFRDTLDWDETPTWPVDADEFVQAWEEKLGAKPDGEPKPRRLDYLLTRDLTVTASGIVTLAGSERNASDHRLVWADVSVT
jgi:endonuclease/exonuclease/phosphatase family metal-dependent hydrolase